MSDGTLFGLVHDIRDRRIAARMRDAKRNYLLNSGSPDEMIQVDPDEGINFQSALAKNRMEMAANEEKIAAAQAERYKGALTNVTMALRTARDKGADVGATYDQLTPMFKNAFRMNDSEIGQWRQAITQNPNILDDMFTSLTDIKDQKPIVGRPGSILWDPSGKVLGRNPGAPKAIPVKRADGGTDIFVMDADGNFVKSTMTDPVDSMGTGPVGPKTIDPTARGVRNNNMGNIKDGPWARRQPGYIGNDGTFAKFQTPEHGTAAQERLLGSNYVNGQRGVQQIVDKYLGFRPGERTENSQAERDNYIAYVSNRLGLDSATPVPREKLPVLAQAMREVENSGGSGGPVKPAASVAGGGQGWRDMTPEEIKAHPGLDPTAAYQIGTSGANTGKIMKVPGVTSTKAGKPAGVTMQTHYAVVDSLQKLRDEARALRNSKAFNQATGSIQGRLPSVFQSTKEFDDRLGSYGSRVFLNTINTLKQNSPRGSTGFGSLTEREGDRILQAQGPLNPTSPDNLRNTLSMHEHDAMVNIGLQYNINPDATMALIRNPGKLRKDFDAKFGVGMSKRILGY